MAITNELHFFYFHDVSDEEYIPNNIRTHTKRYISEIEFICRNFEVIHISQAIEQLKTYFETGAKLQRPTAVVCFDDGFSSFNSIALPKLVELRCPVALFVNGAFCTQEAVAEILIVNKIRKEWHPHQIAELFPDYKTNEPLASYTRRHSCRQQFDLLNAALGADVLAKRPYLSFDDLLRLPEDLVTIGNHTYRHLFLSNISAEEQETEFVENHDALKHLPAYKPIICLPFGSDDSFNDDTRMLVRRHGDAVLMKAVGGTGHRFNDNLVEIERIGLSNNKLPIKHHIRQRTGENVIFPVLWQKVQDRLLASLNRH